LRETLEKEGGTIPDQRKNPKMRYVFEWLTVLYVGSKVEKVLNLRLIHRKILSLMAVNMRGYMVPG